MANKYKSLDEAIKKDPKAKAYAEKKQKEAAKRKTGVVYKNGKWQLVEEPKYWGGSQKKKK